MLTQPYLNTREAITRWHTRTPITAILVAMQSASPITSTRAPERNAPATTIVPLTKANVIHASNARFRRVTANSARATETTAKTKHMTPAYLRERSVRLQESQNTPHAKGRTRTTPLGRCGCVIDETHLTLVTTSVMGSYFNTYLFGVPR